jgi:uncharacterized protein
MKQDFLNKHLDVRAFAQSSGTLVDENLLAGYGRLMQETQGLGAENPLEWSARGESRFDSAGAEQIWLHLKVDALVPLTCQRCLLPADMAISINQSYRFVDSEELAEVQDAQAEEDVLALSADFSLTDLIEDEVLMALPLIPLHDSCPVPVKLAAVDPGFDAAFELKRQPFAVLAKLKAGKSD